MDTLYNMIVIFLQQKICCYFILCYYDLTLRTAKIRKVLFLYHRRTQKQEMPAIR